MTWLSCVIHVDLVLGHDASLDELVLSSIGSTYLISCPSGNIASLGGFQSVIFPAEVIGMSM